MNPETDCQNRDTMPEAKKHITLSRKAIEHIIFEEVTSVAYYNKKYIHPSWPGNADSGVTIGIGYDLGHNTREQIIADWRTRISEDHLQMLLACAGKKGEDAKRLWLSAPVRAVTIPYTEAYKVFVFRTLPRFSRMALDIYPGLDELLPDAAGAIVGMIYNRGNSLKGDRRIEMRAIVPLVAAKDYAGIAEQIEASKRLWQGKGLDGLITRREHEAALVKNAVRQYSQDELIEIPI